MGSRDLEYRPYYLEIPNVVKKKKVQCQNKYRCCNGVIAQPFMPSIFDFGLNSSSKDVNV